MKCLNIILFPLPLSYWKPLMVCFTDAHVGLYIAENEEEYLCLKKTQQSVKYLECWYVLKILH